MFGLSLIYLFGVFALCIGLSWRATIRNVECNLKNIIGASFIILLWPFFAFGTLAGYALIFMDELKL